MKLRTEMHGSDCFFKDGPKDTQHDAMAAHALLRAMGEWWTASDDRGIDETQSPRDAMRYIEDRAAEILASWGVEQDKVTP